MDYRPVFSDQAVAFFATLSRRRQRQLLDRSRELAAYPGVKPDYWSKDSDGNDIANLMVGGFLLAYSVDHAVKTVMIVEIDDAEWGKAANQALQTTSVTRSGFGKVPASDRQRRGV